jgi:hypothetical protein
MFEWQFVTDAEDQHRGPQLESYASRVLDFVGNSLSLDALLGVAFLVSGF